MLRLIVHFATFAEYNIKLHICPKKMMKFHAQLTGKLEQIRFSKVKLNFSNFYRTFSCIIWSSLADGVSSDVIDLLTHFRSSIVKPYV